MYWGRLHSTRIEAVEVEARVGQGEWKTDG